MKFKLPPLFPVKSKKKLRATAVRKPLRIAATADYDEMAEPNMKLSRALLIVLLLHVVAVSGIIAFNAIKTRQATTVSMSRASSSANEKRTNRKARHIPRPPPKKLRTRTSTTPRPDTQQPRLPRKRITKPITRNRARANQERPTSWPKATPRSPSRRSSRFRMTNFLPSITSTIRTSCRSARS